MMMSAIGAKDMNHDWWPGQVGQNDLRPERHSQYCQRVADDQPKNRILIVSFEMSAPQIVDRLVANQSGLTTKRLEPADSKRKANSARWKKP